MEGEERGEHPGPVWRRGGGGKVLPQSFELRLWMSSWGARVGSLYLWPSSSPLPSPLGYCPPPSHHHTPSPQTWYSCCSSPAYSIPSALLLAVFGVPCELCMPKELLSQWAMHPVYGNNFQTHMEDMQRQLGYTEPIQGTAHAETSKRSLDGENNSPNGKRLKKQHLAVIVQTDTVSAVGWPTITTLPPHIYHPNLSRVSPLGPVWCTSSCSL